MKNLGIIIIFVVSVLLYGCSSSGHVSVSNDPYPGYYNNTYYTPSFYGPSYYPYHFDGNYGTHQNHNNHIDLHNGVHNNSHIDHYNGVHHNDHWGNGHNHSQHHNHHGH